MMIESGRAPDVLPKMPLNSLGEWIVKTSVRYKIPKNHMGELMELPGISSLKFTDPNDISLYAMKTLIRGAEVIGCTPEDRLDLAKRESAILERQWKEKGRFIEHTPPRAITAIVKRLSKATPETPYYTNTKLAREALGEGATDREIQSYAERIRKYTRENNLPTVLKAEQGLAVVAEIAQTDEKKRIESEDRKVRDLLKEPRSHISRRSIGLETGYGHTRISEIALECGILGDVQLTPAHKHLIMKRIYELQDAVRERAKSA